MKTTFNMLPFFVKGIWKIISSMEIFPHHLEKSDDCVICKSFLHNTVCFNEFVSDKILNNKIHFSVTNALLSLIRLD